MFGILKRRRPLVFEQWMVPLLDFSSDTPKFYKAVEDAIKEAAMPELVIERILFRDGGPLSPSREYLRVRRELLIFDIGSAKFGKHWWFSCRSAVLPRTLRVWELLLSVIGVAAFAAAYLHMFGVVIGSVALGSTVAMILVMLIAARTWNGLDDLVLKLPVIGAVYEAFLRPESYYRDDARRMYVSVVDHLVREKVKEFALAGGVQEVTFTTINDIQQITSIMERLGSFVGGMIAAPIAAKHS